MKVFNPNNLQNQRVVSKPVNTIRDGKKLVKPIHNPLRRYYFLLITSNATTDTIRTDIATASITGSRDLECLLESDG